MVYYLTVALTQFFFIILLCVFYIPITIYLEENPKRFEQISSLIIGIVSIVLTLLLDYVFLFVENPKFHISMLYYLK